MAKYMITIHEDEARYEGADFLMLMSEHQKFAQEVAEVGAELVGGEALEPSPTATFLRGTRTPGVESIDNPEAGTKEVLGGYYLIEAATDEIARKAAEKCPAPFGYVSYRKVMVFDQD